MCSKYNKKNSKGLNQKARLSSYGCHLHFAPISLVDAMLSDIPALPFPFCTHIFVYGAFCRATQLLFYMMIHLPV